MEMPFFGVFYKINKSNTHWTNTDYLFYSGAHKFPVQKTWLKKQPHITQQEISNSITNELFCTYESIKPIEA